MTELAIEKKPSKLPKVALILGVAFILFMALQDLVPEIYRVFFIDYSNVEYVPMAWDIFDTLDVVVIVFIFLSFMCIAPLFIIRALEKRNRNSVVVATVYTTAMLISTVLLFTTPHYLLVHVLPFIPVIPLIISLGFWADEITKNNVVKSGIITIIICLSVLIISRFLAPQIITRGGGGGGILPYMILTVLLGFSAERYRENKSVFYTCIALIPVLFILTIIELVQPYSLLKLKIGIISLGAILAIIYYFEGKASQYKKGVLLAGIATLITMLSASIMGFCCYNFYFSVFPTLIIFGLFILPAIGYLSNVAKQNGLMLKIAKILPFIAIALVAIFSLCEADMRFASWEYDYYDSAISYSLFGSVIAYILCIASAVMLFIEIKKCNETSQIESNLTENNK